MNIIRSKALRWFLLLLGLGAVIALTGMNVYSLYGLRDQMVESEQERRIDQLDEINSTIRKELLEPFTGFSKIDLEPIEPALNKTGQFPPKIREVLLKASKSKIYTGIYYTPEGVDPCDDDARIYKYNYQTNLVSLTSDYPELLCEGVGLVRTRTKIQLNDINNTWNNNAEFDAHRSMNLGLINLTESKLIGYFTFPLNDKYIVDELITPLLNDYFENSEESGTVAWLYNWVSRQVIATSDASVEYDLDLVDYRHRFTGFLNSWHIHLAFLQTPLDNVYNATLIKNLFVLGVAVLFLVGALIFMFVTAQRERNLAQLQANFIANVTHELKTPLAVMQAAGENISDGRVSESKRLKQYGHHIYTESIRLRRMIEKLLDVARVDSGQIMLKPAPHRIHDLVNKYIAVNEELLEQKGFTLEYISKDKNSMAMVDEDSFETILSNLTENAIKYSGDSKHIKYELFSNEKNIYFVITDKGIGIPKRALKNIFDKFYRVEDPLRAKTKGHGLGLSIVKNLVDLNGGDISVESAEGEGTSFTVRFPKLLKKDYSAKLSDSGKNSTNQTEYVGQT